MQEESSCTTPSALGKPPYPTLSSSGSSSTIFTPAITASSTSAPWAIIVNAFCTAVTSPPFLKRLPFADETTIGLTALCTMMFGNWSTEALVPARVSPATALERMKSRRLIVLIIGSSNEIQAVQSSNFSLRLPGANKREAQAVQSSNFSLRLPRANKREAQAVQSSNFSLRFPLTIHPTSYHSPESDTSTKSVWLLPCPLLPNIVEHWTMAIPTTSLRNRDAQGCGGHN